jgi:predicted TIM-barrel fold metal-dependent hydrolase
MRLGRPRTSIQDKKRDLASRLNRLANELERRAAGMKFEHRKVRALARAEAFRFIVGILRDNGVSVVCKYGITPRD